ncbi:MAG: DctP family TRAP transporter solute-binding subunit [Xanthobacteraceae bacterium]|nr:DctP family TRAP transporter solute-binding subunit [Xanthobacteraceae bacterium]PWB63343.1 MAG: C4-dicarboxylate ABC transporter substrate-binding protein [Bradyrhizobiaceae bacterium]
MTTRLALAALAAFVALAAPPPALAQEKVLKYAHFQPARDDQPKHRAALAFKEHVERATNGQVKVQIFPAGQFGKDQETMEGLRLGTLEMAVAHDGAIATVHKPIGVLGIPFLFNDHAHAWRVYDSKWGADFAEDMRKKTGIRMLALADNGIRHFTNNARPIRSPDDMKGLKIRIQPSPVFKALVESLGASASAIPWAELPTALQGRVVDGQENSVTNILAASLFQYQKHITLNGHVYSVHAYLINDRFFAGLTPDQQRAVLDGAKIARDIHRKMTSDQDLAAKKILSEKGMQVTEIDAATVAAFRKLAQPPVVAWANQEIGKDYVDALLAAVKQGGS